MSIIKFSQPFCDMVYRDWIENIANDHGTAYKCQSIITPILPRYYSVVFRNDMRGLSKQYHYRFMDQLNGKAQRKGRRLSRYVNIKLTSRV